MKLDVLDGMPEVKICTAYRHRGERLDGMPDTVRLSEVEPEYESLAGWQLPPRVAGLDDLPVPARLFLDRIAAVVDVPVTMIGCGRGREELVRVPALTGAEARR
jgi:adenylosuccinate synthase